MSRSNSWNKKSSAAPGTPLALRSRRSALKNSMTSTPTSSCFPAIRRSCALKPSLRFLRRTRAPMLRAPCSRRECLIPLATDGSSAVEMTESTAWSNKQMLRKHSSPLPRSIRRFIVSGPVSLVQPCAGLPRRTPKASTTSPMLSKCLHPPGTGSLRLLLKMLWIPPA
ncbi:unannotated protein [freshwater metagenome]|uniref:Unannotated protein n=1 Tax=freshwater metagenome TaxID=449393 RepID=A0A6J6RD90_9ZZZZ